MSCLHIKINKHNKSIKPVISTNNFLNFKIETPVIYTLKSIEVSTGLNINCDIINTEEFYFS